MCVFIAILLICMTAQPLCCGLVQPFQQQQPREVTTLPENAKVDNKSTILSLINDAGNCSVYTDLKSEQKYERLKDYCERPIPSTLNESEFLSYEVVLCMVLYDTAQRVCRERQGVNKVVRSPSNFSCDAMIKGVPETSAESTKQWVKIFRAKFEKISNCKEKCMQGNLTSPICEYILKASALTQQAQVSSTMSGGASNGVNLEHHGNSQGNGKVNKKITNNDKASEKKAVDQSGAGDRKLPVLKSGSQDTEHVVNKVAVSDNSTVHEDVDHAKARGNNAHSGSENNVGKNAKQQADAEDSNPRNDTNKQAHNTSSSMQNNGTHTIKSNNQSAEVTPHSVAVSPSKDIERPPEGGKYDDSTEKSIPSHSKSAMAAQPENTNSAADDTPDPEIQNQNVGNEESVVSTDDKDNKAQDTNVADNMQSGDEDQEASVNLDHQGKQSKKIPKEIEAHQEEVETGNTAQFNQLGDADDSHFYAYFMTMVVICIIGYLVFHNKQKILALALEGRSRKGTRRRPNTSAYRKLDSNLEEAVTSTCSTSVTHVIY